MCNSFRHTFDDNETDGIIEKLDLCLLFCVDVSIIVFFFISLAQAVLTEYSFFEVKTDNKMRRVFVYAISTVVYVA